MKHASDLGNHRISTPGNNVSADILVGGDSRGTHRNRAPDRHRGPGEPTRPSHRRRHLAIDTWWRANNYLTVGQIYLMANPLLREPPTGEHIKPRLLGH